MVWPDAHWRADFFCRKGKYTSNSKWCVEKGINYWDYPKKGWRKKVKLADKEKKTRIWNNVVAQAKANRVDLSTQALYKTPGMENSNEFRTFKKLLACAKIRYTF